MYTVKEISRLIDMSEHSIRYYCDLGLVPSLKRNKNGNRIFDEESKSWLIGIKNLRGSGMSIRAVKEYVNLYLEGDLTIKRRYDIILEQQEELEKNLKEMQQQYDYLKFKSQMYLDIINKYLPDICNPRLWNKDNK